MDGVLDIWEKIQTDTTSYGMATEGTSDVYLTDEYVFKTGHGSEIWKNMYLNQEASKHGVTVPEVIDWSRQDNVVVYERIHGSTINELSPPESLDIASEVGSQLSRLHQHDYNTFGQLDDSEHVEGESQTYQAEIDRMTTKCKRQSGDSIFDTIADICIETIKEQPTPPAQTSSLVHNDYHGANIISRDGDVVMLDLGGAKLCVPETDFVHAYLSLATGMGDAFADRFAAGYGADIGKVHDVTVCMGVLRQIEVARYWERKQNQKTPTHKKRQLETFLDDRF